MTIDITQIAVGLIGLLATVATVFLVPLLRQKLSEGQLETLNVIIKTFVYAAEQLIGSGKGESKKQKVREWLTEQGFNVNLEEVDAAIEAAVKEMNIAMGK